ncbi:MAG: MFS transporter [Anaerolineales bacterium]|nr:MFS transporter [Anaerolineales bacterium]
MSIKTTLSSHFPALKSRDFFIFWVGQFFSLIGTWMQNTSQPILAYRISGRPFDLGLIGFAATLPMLLLALPGGVLVEHLDKRKTVILCQALMMLQAFTMAALALMGIIQIWHIVVLSFIFGTASAIEVTARQAMLIELVGKNALPNAIALQATIFNAARVLGPSLVTPFLLFIREGGEGWAFLANAISYLFIIVGLFFVQTRFKENKAPDTSPGENLLQEFKQGFRYILSTPSVGMIILMSAILGLTGFPFIQQIPVLAKDVLYQIGDTETIAAARTSYLYTAQGVGALIAALIISFFSSYSKKGLLMTIGQFTFIAALLGTAFSRQVEMTLLLVVVLGWGFVMQLANMITLIQLQVPNQLRGRVFSAFLWALQGAAPLGSLLIGWMTQNWNLPITIVICGSVCGIALLLIHMTTPLLRNLTI